MRNSIIIAGLLLFFSAINFSFAQQYVSQAEHDRLEASIRRSIETQEANIELYQKDIASWERDLDNAIKHGAQSRIPNIKKGLAQAKEFLRQQKAKKAELEAQLQNLPPVRNERAEAERLERAQAQERRQNEQSENIQRQRQELEGVFKSQRQQSEAKSERDAAVVGGIFGVLQDAANARVERNIEKAEREADEDRAETQPYERRTVIPNQQMQETRERTRVIGRIEDKEFIPNAPPSQNETAKPLFDNLGGFFEKTTKLPDKKNFLNEYQNVSAAMAEVLPPDQQFEVSSARILSAWATFDLKGVADAYRGTIDNTFIRGMEEIVRDLPSSRAPTRQLEKRIIGSLDDIPTSKSQTTTNVSVELLRSLEEVTPSSAK